MPKTKKITKHDDEVKTTKKIKTKKKKDKKRIITKEMIAEVAYYKAMQRGFVPGFEEDDWIEAERELNTV